MSFDARTARLLPAGSHIIIDDCAGLRLVATDTSRSWIYRFKSPIDGLMRQVKIGQYPAMPLSLAIAEWSKLREMRAQGIDPAIERKSERANAAAESVKKKLEEKAGVYTVRKLCDDYMKGHVNRNRKEKGAIETGRTFNTMLGQLADFPAAGITRTRAFEFLENFLDTPVQCARLRRELGAAWDYALDAGRLPDETPNWWRQVMSRKIRSKGKKIAGKHVGTGKRFLSDEEVGTLILWLPNLSRMLEDVLILYLWTCTRGAEIMSVEVHEISNEPDGVWWTIPKAKTKNARHSDATDQRVPLVGRAAEIIRRRCDAVRTGYLFPARGGKTHSSQKVVSEGMYFFQPYATMCPDKFRTRLPVTHWAPHDLRRTSRTNLAMLGCRDEVAEALLGHMAEGIKSTYNRHTYDNEKREWLTRLADHYEDLLRP